MKILNLALFVCLSVFISLDATAQSKPNKSKLKTAPATSTKQMPASSVSEDTPFTGYWLTRCGTELTVRSKAGLTKKQVTIDLYNSISNTDLPSIKKALGHKPASCGAGTVDYFMVQLIRNGEIQDVKAGDQSSLVPTCWHLSTIQSFLNECGSSIIPSAAKPAAVCTYKSICSCGGTANEFPCDIKKCDPMFLICPESR